MRAMPVAGVMVAGALAFASGWYVSTTMRPAPRRPTPMGKPAFATLPAHLGNAARLEIVHQGTSLVLERKPEGGWGVAAWHDYPVDLAKLQSLLTGLSQLRLLEPRSAEPSDYPILGVDDPDGKAATGELIRVLDSAGQSLAAVIVGHRRTRTSANLEDELYVRFPDQARSWLAEGSLPLDHEPVAWLDRNLLNISHDRIASVVVGDHTLVFGRQNGRFTLIDPPKHPPLEPYRVEDVARALEMLSFEQMHDDRSPAASPTAQTKAGHAVLTTKDGLSLAVTLLPASGDRWVRFKASGTGAAQAEAEKLNARLVGWAYLIGSWKEKSLVPALSDLAATGQAQASGSQPDTR